MKIYSGDISNYYSYITADDRKWSARFYYYFNGSWYSISADTTKSFQISDYSTDGSNITMGSVMGGKLTANLLKVPKTVTERLTQGTRIKCRLTLKSESATNSVVLTSKTFVIDDRKLVLRAGGSYDISLTAYDLSYLMTKKYKTSHVKPDALQMLEEIADDYGLTVSSSVKENIAKIDEVVHGKIQISGIKNGYYSQSNGDWVRESSVYSKSTDYVSISDDYHFAYYGRGESDAASVLWYDGNKNFLSAEIYYDTTVSGYYANAILVPPSNAKYAIFQSHGYSSSVALTVIPVKAYTPLADFTQKQTLGYLAGCYGCFAYVDSDDKVCFGWYEDNGDQILSDRIFNGSSYVAEMEERTIVMLETGTNDNPIVVPNNASGYSINFENPYITKDQATIIYNDKIAGSAIKFKIGKLSYKGDPLNSPGTIVSVGDKTDVISPFYIMKRTIRYDGGLSETIESQGESETTINYKLTSPTQQRIDRALSKMEEAIKNATDIITQTKGSVFELIPIDANNPSLGNSGWKLYSTEIGSNNVILANSSGIGFSSNGGQSFDAAAIYIDENGKGHINANEVVFDNLTAGAIQTGILKSINGSAVFDLDQNLFKVGSDDYFTQIKSGSLTQHAFDGKLIGGLVPVGNANARDVSLYYNSSTVGTGVGIHEQDESGKFNLIAGFSRNLVTINAPINASGDITLNNGTITTNKGDAFAGLTHTRTIERNNVVSSAKIKVGVGDWSDIYAPIDSKYMIYGGLIFKIYEGKPYYTSTLASANSVPMTEWINPNGSTTLKVSFYYHSYGFAFFDFVYKTKEQIGTNYYYVRTENFLKSTKGDADKTEGYYSGEFTIPENAALIAIRAKPESAASNYWVGWRNVKGGLYLGTKFSASLELLDANNNVASRLDVIDSEGAVHGALRIKTPSGTSSLLEFGSDELWYGGVGILDKLSDLENRLSAIENQ